MNTLGPARQKVRLHSRSASGSTQPGGTRHEQRLVLQVRHSFASRWSAARRRHRGARGAGLQLDVLRVPRHGPRRGVVQSRGSRAHLLADLEPDGRRVRGADRGARGRRRRGRHRLRPVRLPSRRGDDSLRRRPRRVVCRDLRRHPQPAEPHPAALRHRDHVRRADRSAELPARGAAEHEAVLRRDDRQPAHRRARHSRRCRVRPRHRRAADDRQHLRHSVPVAANRARRGHRDALGDQVHRRPRRHPGRRADRQRQVRLGRFGAASRS